METFNISLPTSWAELTDEQLHMVYSLFARDLSSSEVKTLCLMKWNGLQVLSQLPDKRFLIKREKEQVVLSTRQIQQATSVLVFLDNFAPMPVRISRIGKYRALPADFEKVPFTHKNHYTAVGRAPLRYSIEEPKDIYSIAFTSAVILSITSIIGEISSWMVLKTTSVSISK